MGLDDFKAKIEEQLKDLSGKFEELKAKAEKLPDSAKEEINKHLETFQAKRAEIEEKVKGLKGASEEALEEAKKGLETIIGDLKATWDNVLSKFK